MHKDKQQPQKQTKKKKSKDNKQNKTNATQQITQKGIPHQTARSYIQGKNTEQKQYTIQTKNTKQKTKIINTYMIYLFCIPIWFVRLRRKDVPSLKQKIKN